jgi:LysR family nitrogen assimilation transcriptional regulator
LVHRSPRYLERFPEVKLHFLDGYSGYVNEWLVASRVDVAIINSARRSPAIRMDPLVNADLSLLAHCDIAGVIRSQRDTIPFEKAAVMPLVLPHEHHGLRG